MKIQTLIITACGILTALSVLAESGAAKKPENQSYIKSKAEVSYLSGGCFWGMQDLIRKHPGVTNTEVGYMGGSEKNATYELVSSGKTEFAETVKVEFDPKKLTYENLLKFYFKIHDPTTKNQQGNDKGRQYRSVIFYTSADQKKTAEATIQMVNKSKAWKNPIVTEIIESGKWFKAEDNHQDYLVKNPDGYTCHFERKINF